MKNLYQYSLLIYLNMVVIIKPRTSWSDNVHQSTIQYLCRQHIFCLDNTHPLVKLVLLLRRKLCRRTQLDCTGRILCCMNLMINLILVTILLVEETIDIEHWGINKHNRFEVNEICCKEVVLVLIKHQHQGLTRIILVVLCYF